jgi:hypothetical protein
MTIIEPLGAVSTKCDESFVPEAAKTIWTVYAGPQIRALETGDMELISGI